MNKIDTRINLTDLFFKYKTHPKSFTKIEIKITLMIVIN